jgi:hypothetical protein
MPSYTVSSVTQPRAEIQPGRAEPPAELVEKEILERESDGRYRIVGRRPRKATRKAR